MMAMMKNEIAQLSMTASKVDESRRSNYMPADPYPSQCKRRAEIA